MNPFFVYLIKSSISLALLYSLFRFTMRNNRNHSLNRFLLLGILFVSAIIPFLNIQFFYEEIPVKHVEVFREFVAPPMHTEMVSTETVQPILESSSIAVNLWLVIYLLLISALVFRLVLGVFKVTQIIKRAEKRRLHKIVLVLVKDLIQPFTFLNKVVLSEKDFYENKDIIVAHEHAHIKQLHSIDLMVCEVFTVMHFFNPFMWLLRRDLKLIHEYQADLAVLNKGIDAKKYQLLVLQKSVGERRFAMANHFTQKPILKRLKMMQQKNRKQWAALKLILFLPLLMVLLQAFARPELIQSADDFIPVKYTDNKNEEWLSKWDADNIGKGFYEPDLIDKDAPRKENNVLMILMNQNDAFLIENQRKTFDEVKQTVKNYLYGINPDGKKGPDYVESDISKIGKLKVSKGMISYQHDINSSNEMINKTIRTVGEAYLEVRNEKAQVLFNESYLDLDDEKQLAVNKAVPIWFSYEYPKAPPASVWLPFDDKPSDDPKPMNMLVKYDGTIYLGKQMYKNLDEFKENLQAWKKELAERDKESKTKQFYQVDLTCEHGSETEQICSEQLSNIEYVLWKENMRIIHYNHIIYEEDVIRPLEIDRLKSRVQRVKAEQDTIKPPPPPPVLVTIKSDGSVLVGKTKYKSIDEFALSLAEVDKKLYQRDGVSYPIIKSIKVEDGVAENHIKQLKQVLRDAKIQNVNYSVLKSQSEHDGYLIEIKQHGNYIANKKCSLDEIVKQSRVWQKTGREDILLLIDDFVSDTRIDEVRIALNNSNIYNLNQTIRHSNEIIYPAGDVSVAAKFTQGKWNEWLNRKMKYLDEGKPEGWSYKLTFCFVIDKNGKVRNGRILEASDYPEVNEAIEKMLTEIPDWIAAKKGADKVSVLYTGMYSNKVR